MNGYATSGILRESARAAVPAAMKGSKLYEVTVKKAPPSACAGEPSAILMTGPMENAGGAIPTATRSSWRARTDQRGDVG